MDCLLPLLFQGLSNGAIELPDFFTQAPPRLNGVSSQQMNSGKGRYGQAWPNEASSANFLVVWEDGHGNSTLAQQTLDVLEKSWEALTVELGWKIPVSSDDYLLWVILTPELSGTGFTTSYSSSDFPDGYPVIYLNPNYADNTDFWASLSAHEFAHALQYAHRKYTTNEEEPWYWEASAEWQAELALPMVNAYGAQSWYYSEQTHFRYSSMENSHQYGMFLLNAYLEEHLTGPGGIKAIWELAAEAPNKGWDSLIPESTGLSFVEIFGGFTQTMTAMNLQDADHYYPPKRQGVLAEDSSGELAYLGTHYWKVTEDFLVASEGEVQLASATGFGQQVTVRAGEKIAVTGLNATKLADYQLILSPIPEDSGLVDTEETGDTGDTGEPIPEPPSACTCESAPSQKGSHWILAGLCLLFYKRRAPTRHF
jgi:hypothetical protein